MDLNVETMVRRIVSGFQPRRILLFGSRARGTESETSDVDLLVVFDRVEDKRRIAVDIRRALSDLPLCKDVIVTTPDEIDRRGDLPGTVLGPALREGKVLYEQT